MKKINLNLGCGIWLRKDFINVDNYIDFELLLKKGGPYKHAKLEKGAKWVKADIKNMPFPDNYADYVELMNTIEHFPMHRVIDYLKEIHRVMKKGAKLLILTNSFTGSAIDWLQMITQGTFDPEQYRNVAEVIYGNQYGDSEGEVHRCPFTQTFMNYVLNGAGFMKGEMFILPKGAKIPKIGTVNPPSKDSVARNDLLIAEVIK